MATPRPITHGTARVAGIGPKDLPELNQRTTGYRNRRWRTVRRAIHRYKHTILFLSCLMVYLGVPLFEEVGQSLLIEDLFTLGLTLTSLLILNQFRQLRTIGIGLCFALILSIGIENYFRLSAFNRIEALLLPTLYGTVLMAVVGNLFQEQRVNIDHLLGAIAGYFLLGFFWAEIFDLILFFNPHSLNTSPSAPRTQSQLFYFSFSTLVTIGYGDITPHTGLARNAAILEGISGQLYLAILIARLVGLHLHHSVSSRASVPINRSLQPELTGKDR